jgi:hypothetical protein
MSPLKVIILAELWCCEKFSRGLLLSKKSGLKPRLKAKSFWSGT